jgi:hypothetical protein
MMSPNTEGVILRGVDANAAAQEEQKDMSKYIEELCHGMGATLSASVFNQDALEVKLDKYGLKLLEGTCSLSVVARGYLCYVDSSKLARWVGQSMPCFQISLRSFH